MARNTKFLWRRFVLHFLNSKLVRPKKSKVFAQASDVTLLR
jgi:hypothetical protein